MQSGRIPQICVSCVELYLEDTGDKPKRGKPETCWDPRGWQSREPAGAAELAREGAGGGGSSCGGTAKGCVASGVRAAGLHVKSPSGLGVCAEELTQRPETGVPRKAASKVGPRLASGSSDLGRVPPTPQPYNQGRGSGREEDRDEGKNTDRVKNIEYSFCFKNRNLWG